MKKIFLYFIIFSNITYASFDTGKLVAIVGAMCAGKTEELNRILHRYDLARIPVVVFKPDTDTRVFTENNGAVIHEQPTAQIQSRTGSSRSCYPFATCSTISNIIEEKKPKIIAFDEIMLAKDPKVLIALIKNLLKEGKQIFVAGLDSDFRGEPFGCMPELLALADQVIKLTAICSVCKKDTYCLTQRLIDGRPAHEDDPIIMVEGSCKEQKYEPRCRNCHIVRKRNQE
ncbi:hypothetical protein KAZ82_02050 [Candidatus Babeliales bacterium]|nr:hypothetical protein [Candidatus Babeliales bacterium]